MKEYLPFYNYELDGLLESNFDIHEKYYALDSIRNILTDLRADLATTKANIRDPEDPVYVTLEIVIDKVLKRIQYTNKTINILLDTKTESENMK